MAMTLHRERLVARPGRRVSLPPESGQRERVVDQELQDTIDVVALGRLQAAYADAVTRRAWVELDDLFLPEATVSIDKRDGEILDLTGPRTVGDFIAKAISCFEFFEFVILNRHIILHHE